MATKIQHKRTSTFSAAWPTLSPGELAFNGPQLKIALGDPNTGAPLELLAVRFFSTTSSYATNDFIATAGTLLRAVHAVAPGPFNAADWAGAAAGVPEAPIDGKAYLRQNAAWAAATLASIGAVEEAPNDGKAYSRKSIAWAQLTATDVTYGAGSVSDALGNMITPAQMTSDNVTNTSGVPGVTVSNALVGLQSVDATKAPLASPAFTGTPTAPTPPAADNSTKVPTTAWVQSLASGKASIITSDVPPVTPADNTIWWESDTAKLYLRYNDGNSSQWVQVNAAAGMGGYVTKIGDTMTGNLKIATSTSAALILSKAAGANYNTLYGNLGNLSRWSVHLGDNGAESTGNAGSNFYVNRYADDGTLIDSPFYINRSNGQATFPSSSSGVFFGSTIQVTGAAQFNGTATFNNPTVTISPSSGNANLFMNKQSLQPASIFGRQNNNTRWRIDVADASQETGSNAGSDFTINRYTDAAAFNDTPLRIARDVGSVTIKGTTINDNAPAGMVGEVLSITGGTVTLANGVTANVTTLTLTPGDWDVTGECWTTFGTGGGTGLQSGLSTTSVTFPATPNIGGARAAVFATLPASSLQFQCLRPMRISAASSITVYLVANAGFGSGTTTAIGCIWARRAR